MMFILAHMTVIQRGEGVDKISFCSHIVVVGAGYYFDNMFFIANLRMQQLNL